MERLTQFNESFYEIKDDKGNLIASKYSKLDQVITKLGKLEDIEEELGCPLNILKPGQKVEFYKDEKKYSEDIFGINLQRKTIMLGNAWNFMDLPLDSYGRLWWLKEDRSE